tara:strand:+ start:530828 stop:533242 length:2415 start_codon:yes stop_codon:yes gene_type:complete
MEFEKKTNGQWINIADGNIDLREIIEKYLRYWKWFLLSVFISIALAFLYLNFERKIYVAEATIKIKSENGSDASTLSVFKDLGVATSNQNVEDEIEVLISKDLISEVVKSLKFNIQFYTDKNYISEFLDDNLSFETEYYERERYKNAPIEINFIMTDSVLYKTFSKFNIVINSVNNFTFLDKENFIEKSYDFGKKVKTSFGEIIITPNPALKVEDLVGEDILVTILPIKGLATSYAKRITIEPKSEFSSILSLKVSNSHKLKAEDFLNELVVKYNDRAIRLKEEITKSTSDFVDKRLEIISGQLLEVDLSAESIKTRYAATNNTGINLQSGQAIENQIVQASMQLQQIKSVKEFVISKDNDDIIPVDVGVNDNYVSSTIDKYNELMLQKKKFLENSTDKNPIVVNLNEQLISLKSNIDQGLSNLESSQKISIEALSEQDARINSRLYSAPKQERQIRDVQRQQGIKEALYLYLLQKREETAITLGVVDPNAKIIDSPAVSPNTIAPKKMMTYIMFFIIAMLIPFSIIYISDLLDRRIHTREDVERILNIPVIGDIPKIESKGNYLIKKKDYSSIAEAFRILRTNLGFILPNNGIEKNIGKTFFITSTIAHEGKSLVASNLATALAHAGHNTLLLGLDIRAPNIKPYLGIKSKQGITNYIIDSEVLIEDITTSVSNIENLSIITSGDLAPNPAELLLSPRVKELFESVKANYDYIIVDTAAYSMVTDTLLISKHADAFIYVVRANFIDHRALKYVKTLYNEKKIPNMNILVNGIDHKKSHGYGYGYGYGVDYENSKKPWWKKINS